MKLTPKVADLATLKTDCLAGGLVEGKGLEGIFLKLDRSADQFISKILKRENFHGKKGESKLIHLPAGLQIGTVFLYGLGKEPDLDLIRKGAARAVKAADKIRAKQIALQFPLGGGKKKPTGGNAVQAVAEGLILGHYRFDLYKTEKKEDPQTVETAEILVGTGGELKSAEAAIETATAAAEATNFARDLINIPANDLTPSRMAEEAKKVGRLPGLSVRIYNKGEIEKMGMGSFLAVARGSAEPPCLIHLVYRPSGRPSGSGGGSGGGRANKKIALVGKGVTFDSGGLSLKTAQSMETMKDDMSGAAAVVAVMKALSTLKPPVEVHAVAAMTENMPSGSGDRPGDVARSMIGKTIEILNTDAEGRLTLADAIPFALKQKPDLVIDVATLTGACVIALGELCAGILGNNQPLIDRLIEAGQAVGEKIWQLPLIEEYREELKSTVADVKNVGGRWGGTINGALFIQEFVEESVPWAHVDIAGPSWTEKELDLCPKGGTGFSVRTLLRFITDLAQ